MLECRLVLLLVLLEEQWCTAIVPRSYLVIDKEEEKKVPGMIG